RSGQRRRTTSSSVRSAAAIMVTEASLQPSSVTAPLRRDGPRISRTSGVRHVAAFSTSAGASLSSIEVALVDLAVHGGAAAADEPGSKTFAALDGAEGGHELEDLFHRRRTLLRVGRAAVGMKYRCCRYNSHARQRFAAGDQACHRFKAGDEIARKPPGPEQPRAFGQRSQKAVAPVLAALARAHLLEQVGIPDLQ